MTYLMVSKRILFLLFAILILGLFLRHKDFRDTPRPGATFDEYVWTWLGINLIENHVPISWSPHPQYEKYRVYKEYQGAKFWIVKPYLEHPPFFGLVAGSFAIANGVRDMYQVSVDRIRPLALLLGIFSILSLFLLVRQLYDDKTALLSSLIYATIPTVVIGSRIVQNENFFIPVFLFSLYLIAKFIKTDRAFFRNIAGVLAGLLTISKVPWFAAPLAIVMILFYKKRYKDSLKFLLIVLPIFSLYIFYGLHYNPDLFISLWKLQLQRYDIGYNSIYALFTQPYMVDRYFVDGWIYFGWFSFIILLTKKFKENYIIILALLAYFAVFIFAIPNEPGHGWYRYPFYPFLAVSLALFIKEYFNKNLILTFFFIVLVGVSLLENTFGTTVGFSFKLFRTFLIVSGITLLPLFFQNIKIARLSSAFNYTMLGLLFLLNVFAVFDYSER